MNRSTNSSRFEGQRNKPLSLKNGEQGATAIEYGLIAALIAVAAILAMQHLGSKQNTTVADANISAPTN